MILIISLLTDEICSILQGFIPLQLFLLFINYLDIEITEQQIIKKFADDVKIAQFIESSEDSVALQATCTLEKKNPRMCTWWMEEKEIRVTVSCNLKPGQQYKKAAQTASMVLDQITRAFHYKDRKVFLNLYK